MQPPPRPRDPPPPAIIHECSIMNRIWSSIRWAVVPFLVAAPTVSAQDAGWTPNGILEVNRVLAARLAATPLDRVEPVRDNILKTDIYGTGHTRGTVTVEFVPSDDVAVMDLV